MNFKLYYIFVLVQIILGKFFAAGPKKCKECDEIITYNKRDNKFCSSNCSAKFNNKNRGNLPDNVKEKISLSLKIKQKGGYQLYQPRFTYC